MQKRVDRRSRRGAAPARSARRRRVSTPRADTPARRNDRAERPLLERILDTPHLARVVPQLPPEVLHRVIQTCGLEDCGELMALATAGQLSAIFDLDLWRADRPGLDHQFDADRFGVWLAVLLEAGDARAAQKLADIDVDLVVAALAQHVLVFDQASGVRGPEEALDCQVGGYRVVAKHSEAWEAIVIVLNALDAEHGPFFHRVMRGCRSLSNSRPEIDGLDDLLPDGEQVMYDLAAERERRRERQGHAAPAEARAFLQLSRHLRLEQEAAPAHDPVARAYFRALDWTPETGADSQLDVLPAAASMSSSSEATDPLVAVMDVLVEAGVLPPQHRALLEGTDDGPRRLARIQAHLRVALERNPAAYVARSQELAYLANTLLAGCSIQARPLTEQEASDGAVAICNLGLENWPGHWLATGAPRPSSGEETAALPDDFLVTQDLVSVFQVGWTILHSEVCMHAARRLIGVLQRLRCDDGELQAGLEALRVEMTKQWRAGTPWRADDALDVLATLDMPAWAAVVALIAECPVLHAALGAGHSSRTRSVSATAFEFISENSQIASVHAFMTELPAILGG
jgi:hypothetical protein